MKIKKTIHCTFLIATVLGSYHTQAFDKTKIPAKEPKQDHSIAFAENKQQWEPVVKYKANLPGGNVFLTQEGFTYNYFSLSDINQIHDKRYHQQGASTENNVVNCHAYRVAFSGANMQAKITAEGKKSYYQNYFIGKDRSKWAGNVSVFEKVTYHDIYNGIDAVIYSKGTSMKYDFIVAPGAKTGDIKLRFEGVTPQLLSNGNILIKTSVNQIEEGAPYVYQIIDGVEHEIKSKYTFNAKEGTIGFSFPEGYDKTRALIIDPTLVFGTYSGGTGSTFGFSATYDSDGSLYAGGECFGVGWPTTVGAYQVDYANNVDAGINKYNATGTDLVYSTYFGGSNGSDVPNNMVVNTAGELVICGATASNDLATTTGCISDTYGGNTDIYVAHFNATGTDLLGATYLGGSQTDAQNTWNLSPNGGDANRGEVFTDAAGNIFIASSTMSDDFPVAGNAVQTSKSGSQDGVIAKMDPTCSTLLYSTFLGGDQDDACFALVLTSGDNIVTVGGTKSSDFPTSTGALHGALDGETDGFATVINLTTGIVSSTYLGTGDYDHAFKVQVDPSNNVFVMGQTASDYPISAGVYSIADGDIFIDKLSPDLSSSLLSTRLGNPQGGFQKFTPTAFLLDECGNTYLCGYNLSQNDLPVSPDAFATEGGFWLAVLEPDFTDLMYATFIGGGNHVDGGTSRFDPKGIVYHSVCTSQLDFPTNPNVWSPNKLASGYDCASFKFNFEATGVQAEFMLATNSSDSGCAPHTVSFVNESLVADNYVWDFGDGTPTTTTTDPTHTFTEPGIYTVTLHANNPLSCITDDTFRTKIYVFSAPEPQLVLNDTLICLFQPVDITVNVLNPTGNVTYAWTPVAAINGSIDLQTVNVNPNLSQDFTVTVTNTDGLCSNQSSASMHIDVFDPILLTMVSNDTTICEGESVPLVILGDQRFTYQWSPDIEITNPNASSTVATPSQSREYMVTVTFGDCLPHQHAVKVDVEPVPQVNAGPDRILCSYDTAQLFAAVLPFAFTPYTYEWHPGVSLTDSLSQTPVFKSEHSAELELIVKTPIGCTGKDMVRLTVNPGKFLEISPDTGMCPPASVALHASGALSYSWNPSYGLSDPLIANPLASPETSVTYTATGVNQFNCIDSQQVTVDVYPRAVISMPDSVTIWPGESYQISPSGNCLYSHWFPPSGLSATNVSDPVASPEVRTRYFVTATTEHGCIIKDSIDVLVNEESALDMPNAFTPGDALNGELKVVRRGLATLKYFRVYNRWGNKVFESTDINKGWDGRYNNSPQPLGVYVYSIEAVTNTGKVFTKQGNVTLIR